MTLTRNALHINFTHLHKMNYAQNGGNNGDNANKILVSARETSTS